jgi:hypothetical protein
VATIAPIQALLTTATCGSAGLAPAALADPGDTFFQASLRRLYPETAYQKIVSVSPPRHLSEGKGRFDLFRVDVDFEDGLTRSLLVFVSQVPVLDGLYEAISLRTFGLQTDRL